MFPKIGVGPPNHPLFFRFSIVFTIHLGVKTPFFGSTPIYKRVDFYLVHESVYTIVPMDPLSPKMNQASRATFVGDILEEVVGILRSARWKREVANKNRDFHTKRDNDGGWWINPGVEKKPLVFILMDFL